MRDDYTEESAQRVEEALGAFMEVCGKVKRTFDLEDERGGWIDYQAMTEELSGALDDIAKAWEALEERE